MEIVKAQIADVEAIEQVMACARHIMQADGNPNQWTNGYPDRGTLLADIESGVAHICKDHGQVVAYFALLDGPDDSYAEIEGGHWVDDEQPYVVIHRLASAGKVRGVFAAVMNYALCQCKNIRIDTHRDNHIMQHCLQKNGFAYCGIIRLVRSGDERLAYQKVCS